MLNKPLGDLFATIGGPAQQALTSPLAPVAQTLTSPSGRRSYPRINLPIDVYIGEARYQASNWSLGGLRLRNGPPAAEGDLMKLGLNLDFVSFGIALDMKAEVVAVERGKAVSFQFIDVPAEKAAVLRLVADKWLAGELVNLSDLMTPGQEIARLAFTDRSTWALRRTGTVIRFATLMAVLAAVVATSLYYVSATLLTVRSEYAAVAAEMTVIRAPENGFVAGPGLGLGANVRRGQAIAAFEPSVTPQALTELQGRLGVLTAQLAEQRAAVKAATIGFDSFKRVAEQDLKKVHADRLLMERQVAAEQRSYARIAAAVAAGDLGKAQSDQEEVKLVVLQAGLNNARAAEADAEQRLKAAGQGLYTTNGGSTQRTPDDLQRDVQVTEAEIARINGMLGAMKSGLPMVSPCDCTVAAVLAQSGEFLLQGTPVYRLSGHDGRAVEVDALIPNDRLRYLLLGQDAKVLLANSASDTAAHITNVSFNPLVMSRVGLPDTLRSFGQYAVVTVTLDTPASAGKPVNGMPAVVTFHVSAGMLFQYVTGLAWFIDRPPALRSDPVTAPRATASLPPA